MLAVLHTPSVESVLFSVPKTSEPGPGFSLLPVVVGVVVGALVLAIVVISVIIIIVLCW